MLYRWHGKLTEIGLGSLREVPLARARELAAAGAQADREWREPEQSRVRGNDDATFGACAARLIASLRPSWRSATPRSAMAGHLTKEAARLAPIPVNTVTTEDVLAVLQPLWQTKPRHGAAAARSHRTRA